MNSGAASREASGGPPAVQGDQGVRQPGGAQRVPDRRLQRRVRRAAGRDQLQQGEHPPVGEQRRPAGPARGGEGAAGVGDLQVSLRLFQQVCLQLLFLIILFCELFLKITKVI